MDYAFPLDPRVVLGVEADASLQEIRDAYRTQSKRYHPDVGGDEWAFRVVARSYELLCTARVMGRASEEMARSPARSPEPRPRTASGHDRRVREGVHDTGVAAERLVNVEQLLIRYEIDSPTSLMTERPEERNLSCTLNLAWPRPDAPSPGSDAARSLRMALEDAFREVAGRSAPTASSADEDPGRFAGWLTYPTARKADDAFKLLHAALLARGLGAVETIREVTIPREWK